VNKLTTVSSWLGMTRLAESTGTRSSQPTICKMTRTIGTIGLFFLTSGLVANESMPANQFTIVGQYTLDETVTSDDVFGNENVEVKVVVRSNAQDEVYTTREAELVSGSFTEGNEVSLTDVLHDNKYVYIDFWASWCTPCIEDFPELKDLHASYSDDGFEVLTISVDDTHDEWKEAAEKIEFPWIDVGSLGGTETEPPVSYGVQGFPKGFLVDKEGCIVQKDIRPDRLKNELATRYAEPMTTD